MEHLNEKKGNLWKEFFKLIKKIKIPWILIGIGFVISILNSRLSVVFPDYQRKYFERGNISTDIIVVGVLILLGSGILKITKLSLEAVINTEISKSFRNSLLEKVFRFSFQNFDDMNNREFISRATNDTSVIGEFIVTISVSLLSIIYSLYLGLKLIYEYNYWLFIFQIFFIPIMVFVKIFEGKIVAIFQYRIQSRLSTLTEYLAEMLTNIPIIKIFSTEDKESNRGEETIEEYNKVIVKSNFISSLFMMGSSFVSTANKVFAIVYGGYLVSSGVLDIGTWIAYFIIVGRVDMDLQVIINQWVGLKSVQGAVSRVAHIMEMEEENYDGIEFKDDGSNIRFSEVGLNFNNKEILKNINFEINRGNIIAIVGSSGSGKSTLLNLIERFYIPNKGSIELGDNDISDLGLHPYRDMFSYVSQDITLFNDTLRYNICYGTEREVTDEEILAVCKIANLEKFVDSQINGLDSIIYENGTNLSGGERQRIGIARAILRDSKIILLDEATANLDAESEKEVLEEIKELSLGRTLIMVVHRMGLIKDADKIIVLDKGMIVGEGTHNQLLNNCDKYRKMVEAERVGNDEQ